MKQAIIGLGSNIGERLANIQEAVAQLADNGCNILAKSRVYQTEPWGYKEQADFLNAAVLLETDASPQELLKITQGIEKNMGRDKKFLNGPRNIDLDILVYEGQEINTEVLTVPHARLHQRLFVLKPLADIAPQWQIKDLGTVAELLANHAGNERVEETGLSL